MRHSRLLVLFALTGLGVSACDTAPGIAGPEIAVTALSVVPAGGYEAVDLGDLGGGISGAQALNGPGAVVGWSYDASGQQRAMYWSGTTGMIDISAPGSARAYAQAINDVNGDGLPDAMLHFDVPALVANGDISSASGELCVSGETTAGDAFQGCDVVTVR